MRPLVLMLLAGGCGASQFLVHVDTDAPVPASVGASTDPLRPAWLFDQLRVEILRGGAPVSGTRRDFSVDESMFAERRVSFGIAPPFGDPDLSLQLRLFRGDHTIGGEPMPAATLETNVVLSTLSESSGPIDLRVLLRVEDVGQPRVEEPTLGEVEQSQVGTWPGARVIPCVGEPKPNEVCVAGGAFWMGDPLLREIDPVFGLSEERLVVVAPFFLDAHEVTVAEMRGRATTPTAWTGTSDPDIYDNWCTFTKAASPADPDDTHAALAANCMTCFDAESHCKSRGGTLPSEAQFEFVASGRGQERSFPWGGDEPDCDDAVWGWGGVGQTLGYTAECRTHNQPGGVQAPGGGKRDRIRITNPMTQVSGEVLDLAGNLSEWTRDVWSRQSEDFWARRGVFVDPVADLVSPTDGPDLRAFRGGAFHDPPLLVRSAARYNARTDRGYVFYKVGWRCVRPAASQ